ncbi:MAG: hypothetical protein EOP05_23040 [Proteobacteria bacterium]|nr:MAG: hypothetical protein EOP05_23040 [Pseudomonadota bacterium]
MRFDNDPLYLIFEQHLFTALVEEEALEDFMGRVVSDYVAHLQVMGTVIPQQLRAGLEQDLRDEVLEMFRKKTYGHYSLSEFRKAKGVVSTPDTLIPVFQHEKTRRRGRAC